MIRLTQTLLTSFARPNVTLLPAILSLTTQPKYFFSLHSSHKVLDMIKNERHEDNLDKICIEISSLSSAAKEQAIQAVIEKVKAQQFSPAVLLHEKYNIHLKKYPKLLYEAYKLRIEQSLFELARFLINGEQKGMVIAVEDINKSFDICFEAIEKMEEADEIRCQIQIFPLFAHYNANFMRQVVNSEQQKECLETAKEYYESAVESLFQLLEEEYGRSQQAEEAVQLEDNNEDLTIQEKAAATKEQIQISQQEYNYIEQLAQNLIDLVQVKQELYQLNEAKNIGQLTSQEKEQQNNNQKEVQEQVETQKKEQDQLESKYSMDGFAEEAMQLIPLFGRCLKMYQKFGAQIPYSLNYHQLKRLGLNLEQSRQLNTIKKSDKSQEEKQTAIVEYLNQIEDNSEYFLQEILNHFTLFATKTKDPQELQQFAQVAMAVHTQNWQYSEDITEEDVQQFANMITELLTPLEDRQLRLTVLKGLIDQARQSYRVDISSFVEKVPRAMRMQRTRRNLL